jgi:hypothetical protein
VTNATCTELTAGAYYEVYIETILEDRPLVRSASTFDATSILAIFLAVAC